MFGYCYGVAYICISLTTKEKLNFMKNNQEEVVNSFIINVLLISPIKDILNMIENKQIRDCDISWLDNKFESFADIAAKTIGITVPKTSSSSLEGRVWNDLAKEKYKNRFNTLLNYFVQF